jgi:hypothetical protein
VITIVVGLRASADAIRPLRDAKGHHAQSDEEHPEDGRIYGGHGGCLEAGSANRERSLR